MDSDNKTPFKVLGDKLKAIRQMLHESTIEVCGAVEIDESLLNNIEQGRVRPSEDILLLLINHFGMKDEEADKLWRLAGYDIPHNHDDDDASDQRSPQDNHGRATLMIMAIDPRIIYSDGVQITANDSGVVLNFAQGSGTPQTMVTARVGMSREQATNLMYTLQRALDGGKPRQLPATTADGSGGNQADAANSKATRSDTGGDGGRRPSNDSSK